MNAVYAIAMLYLLLRCEFRNGDGFTYSSSCLPASNLPAFILF